MLGNHNDGLDAEPSIAMVEEVLEGGSKQIDDEDVVQTFLSKVVHIGNAGCHHVSLVQKIRYTGDML